MAVPLAKCQQFISLSECTIKFYCIMLFKIQCCCHTSKPFVYAFSILVSMGGVSELINLCQNDNHVITDSFGKIYHVQRRHGWTCGGARTSAYSKHRQLCQFTANLKI